MRMRSDRSGQLRAISQSDKKIRLATTGKNRKPQDGLGWATTKSLRKEESGRTGDDQKKAAASIGAFLRWAWESVLGKLPELCVVSSDGRRRKWRISEQLARSVPRW